MTENKTIVFTCGVFDALHPGHFNLLTFCRVLAGSGKVIVAIDEDEKVQADKRLKRPIFNVHERAKAVLDLKFIDPLVDQVMFFNTDHELENLVKRIRPTYLVKGSDWRGRHVVGSDYAEVLYFERMEYSTTDIVTRVLEKYNVK